MAGGGVDAALLRFDSKTQPASLDQLCVCVWCVCVCACAFVVLLCARMHHMSASPFCASARVRHLCVCVSMCVRVKGIRGLGGDN